MFDVGRFEGLKEGVLFLSLSEPDVGELLFIAVEEEVVEPVDQAPDFPRGLDFLFRFHFFPFLY